MPAFAAGRQELVLRRVQSRSWTTPPIAIAGR
jgi:hypothetical protein